jgi:serine protease Do
MKFEPTKTMKTKPIVLIAAAAVLPLTGFAQTPPAPSPNPPGQPVPPVPPEPPDSSRDREPKAPVTYLGIETSEVPSVLSEQLGLPKGFGLVVDYVVPDGPAAAAGVQQNDILRMLNDQILTEPGQLAKLVRSFSEGTNVTLVLLRKGTEKRVTAKLGKKDMPMRHGMFPGFEKHWNFHQDFGDLGRQMQEMGQEFGDAKQGMIHDAVEKARQEVIRARDEARRAARQVQVVRTKNDDGAMSTTRIDLAKAQIVFSDNQGEMRIDSADGKKVLTAKDPQGRLVFSGPIETKEDLDKMPPDLRKRFDKLEEKDLPSTVQPNNPVPDEDSSDSASDSIDQVSVRRHVWAPGTLQI